MNAKLVTKLKERAKWNVEPLGSLFFFCTLIAKICANLLEYYGFIERKFMIV